MWRDVFDFSFRNDQQYILVILGKVMVVAKQILHIHIYSTAATAASVYEYVSEREITYT